MPPHCGKTSQSDGWHYRDSQPYPEVSRSGAAEDFFHYLVQHQVSELLRQRIGALALGYEDLNDHDRLRHDPLHALMAGKADVLGEDRLCQETRARRWRPTRP